MNVVHVMSNQTIFYSRQCTVKVTDFGIARVADFEDAHLTKTGVMMGTLALRLPEHYKTRKTSIIAQTFFRWCGHLRSSFRNGAFSGDGIAQTIVKIVSQEERPLHMLNPGVGVTSPVVSQNHYARKHVIVIARSMNLVAISLKL